MNLTRKKSFLGLLKPQQKKNFIDFGLLIPNLLNSIDKIESAFCVKLNCKIMCVGVCVCERERERDCICCAWKMCLLCEFFSLKSKFLKTCKKESFVSKYLTDEIAKFSQSSKKLQTSLRYFVFSIIFLWKLFVDLMSYLARLSNKSHIFSVFPQKDQILNMYLLK